jgi:hypothetical protein
VFISSPQRNPNAWAARRKSHRLDPFGSLNVYDSFLPFYPAVMSKLMRNAGCIREDADQYQEKASSLAAAGS